MTIPGPYLPNRRFLSSVVNILYKGDSYEMGRSRFIVLGFAITLQVHPAEKTQHNP